jgi:hypothetical protein
MSQILKQEFHTNLASQFVKEVQLQKSNLYYYLGKASSWGVPDFPPESTTALTLSNDSSIRENMLYMNKIMPNDVSLCANRYDWVTGTTYARWDDTVAMEDLNFYVVNTSFRVYKCLDNNGGVASTVEPSAGDGLEVFRAADGYVWKYMYSIPSFKQFKFTNSQYIPVQNAISDSFYNRGAVEDIIINAPGSGYSSASATTLSVSGDGSGAVLIPVIDAAGSIIRVKIVSGGSGYTTAPTIVIAGAGTHKYPENSGGAILTAIVSAGVIQSVLVVDPGISYVSNNSSTIAVKGDGSGAVLTPVVYAGGIVDVVIENNGTGYSYMILTVGGTGTGASLTANIGLNDTISDQSVVEQLAVAGGIYAAKVTTAGNGYDPLITPKITITGDGKGATALAIMSTGTLVGVKMLTFGSGYSYADFVVEAPTGGSPVTATVSAIKAPYYGHGYDAVNELGADVICISSVLSANSIISDINQDFRQYGVIKNPRQLYSNSFTSTSEALLAYKMTMLSTSGMASDMELRSANNYRYLVVKFDATTAYLQPLSGNNVPPLGSLSDGTTTWFATDLISSPAVNKYSGDILTVASEVPFKFTSEQSLALKTYIKC